MAWAELRQRWAAGAWVVLAGPGEEPPALPGGAALPPGPGVVLGSGGSSGARRWCVQPLAHLEASARATATWLEALGVDPSACLHLNPLPEHHVSGLLPRLRAAQWGGEHRAIAPALMRDPAGLAGAVALPPARPALLSLVPTQLERLLADPAGLAWLRQLAVIWVGGAALPAELAGRARRARVRLAPCYGATETAAMVTALAPEAFLAGVEGCGAALADVELRLDPAGAALELRTARLSPGYLEAGRLAPLPRTADGWWRSADGAALGPAGVRLLGRLDGAISSGGETVFPEQVERRLWARCRAAGLPVTALLLLAEPDPTWGARLVALVRLEAGVAAAATLAALRALAAPLPPSQRPRRWLSCPELAPSPLGKWERQRWRAWLAHQADSER
jgi:O-succinylbenzoic acid--CoA ligase